VRAPHASARARARARGSDEMCARRGHAFERAERSTRATVTLSRGAPRDSSSA